MKLARETQIFGRERVGVYVTPLDFFLFSIGTKSFDLVFNLYS